MARCSKPRASLTVPCGNRRRTGETVDLNLYSATISIWDRTRVDTSCCDRSCNRRPARSRQSRASPVRQRAGKRCCAAARPRGIYNIFGLDGTGLGRTTVRYDSKYAPGTIVINTKERRLYLVQGGGSALRCIGVGRIGFQWKGAHKITAKKEFPNWTAPRR